MFSKFASVFAIVVALGGITAGESAYAVDSDAIKKAVKKIASTNSATDDFYITNIDEAVKSVRDGGTVHSDVAIALLKSAEHEIRALADATTLRAVFSIMGEYLSIHYADQVKELIGLYGSLHKDKADKSVLDSMRSAESRVRNGPPKAGNSSNIFQQNYKDVLPTAKDSIEEELQRVQNWLEKVVKGQPEAIRELMDIRRRDLIYGTRDASENLLMLGLPGTGRETLAKAYVDAIWGYEGAYKEHMFAVPAVTDHSGYFSVMGAGAGYKDGENFPPILDFLVKHSCGRYEKEEVKAAPGAPTAFRIIENANWQKDGNKDYCPQNAVLFLDDFHNWAAKYKDLIIKKALDEKDPYFVVKNPLGGVDKIHVPVTILMASNEGMELIASREQSGERFGSPLSAEQMLERHARVKDNKDLLKESLILPNSSKEDGPGTSNDLKTSLNVVLFRPLMPEHLQEIVHDYVRAQLEKLGRGRLKDVSISYSQDILELVQQYDYVAEDNARPISKHVKALFEAPLLDLVAKGVVNGKAKNLALGMRKLEDGTYELIAKVDGKEVAQPVAATEAKRAQKPLTNEQLDALDKIGGRLTEIVIGQDSALEEVARMLKNSEEGRQGVRSQADAKVPARVMMFLGWTSTGKTETMKAVAEVLMGDRNAAHVIAFSPATDEHFIKSKITGITDHMGRCIPSEFMKAYDRNGGRFVVGFDEIANVRDKDVLNMLYDIFREPVVTTFCDRKPRVMSNVAIVLTGNAGQEVLNELPSGLPRVIRRAALNEANQLLVNDPNLRRSVHERYFSHAMLARFGDRRIFHYAPLDYLAAAKLFQLKLISAMKELKPTISRHGWEVSFASESHYRQIIDAFEREGFEEMEQGASVDRFVNEIFKDSLREMLLFKLRVPSGSKVTLEFVEIEKAQTEENSGRPGSKKIVLAVNTVVGRHLLKLNGTQNSEEPIQLKEELLMTAFHEAGHALVAKTYFSSYREPVHIKILPGVSRVLDKWIHYAGVATSQGLVNIPQTIEYVLREIAVLMGGAVAEELVQKTGGARAGKSDDIARATSLAEAAILKYGLVDAWGVRVTDKAQMSEADKNKLTELTEELIKEGTELARLAIMANTETFVAMGNSLAEMGILEAAALKEIFISTKVNLEENSDLVKLAQQNEGLYYLKKEKKRGLKIDLNDRLKILSLDKVVDLEGMLERKRTAEIAKLVIAKEIPVGGVVVEMPKAAEKKSTAKSAGKSASKAKSKCDDLLAPKK